MTERRPPDAKVVPLPAPRPGAELVVDALAFWQPRTSRALTTEDARQMIENVAGFFSLLARWQAEAERRVSGLEDESAA